MRITMEMLRVKVDLLNKTLGVDCFRIGSAYGQYRLEKLTNEHGGVRGYSPYRTKKETAEYIDAFLDGIYEIRK